ncbi:MAG: outer membrane beta-barrel family protein [Prevotella sp.]|nr:outer membrane beta-barrel family protein [Prevotella sp.]
MKTYKIMLLSLLLAAKAGASCAQTDSLSVKKDSVAWNQSLDGVTITAQRQLIKQEIDRVGYDVQADEDSKTETVLDMLRKVPMVTVDGEDKILVKGNSNFKIHRNGRLDPTMTKNAKDVLKAMPASAVKRIEVITDPGAREDAEGVDAILNIVMMDTKKLQGVTGNVSGTYSSLKMPSLSTYLATQMGKAIVSVYYGNNYMSEKATTTKNDVERTFVGTGNTQRVHSEGSNPGNLHSADINASYDIDSLNLLSASFGGYFYKINVQGGGPISMFDPSGNLLYSYNEHYWMPHYSHHSWDGSFDYQHKTRRKGEQFTLSYLFALTRQRSEQETTYSQQQNFPFNYDGYLVSARERFTEHTFQFDYVRPLWEGHKLQVGTKYIDRRNNGENSQQFYDAPRTTTNDAFNHTTRVAALYADYMLNSGKWMARAGLRYEYSYMKGHFPDGKSADFDKNLSDWVPQASVKYQITPAQSLKLSYTTSINRPGISYLNPAVKRFPQSVSFGNAHLVSSTNRTIALNYMNVGPKLTFHLTPQFQFCNDNIGAITYADGDTRYSTYGNVIRHRRWQVQGYVQWKPFEKTTLVANLDVWHSRFENPEQQLSMNSTNVWYYFNISQKLPWKLQATASTYGQLGRASQNIYSSYEPYNRYSFTLQRSFLSDDRLTVRLTAISLFHKRQHFETRTTQGDILGWSDTINNQNGRWFRLSVSYRFGKLKASVKKTDTTIQNDDEVGGIVKGQM